MVCDNPKRSDVRCALCHSATYACEYCEAQAVAVHENITESQVASIKKKYELRKKNLQNTIDFLRESPGSSAAKIKDGKKIDDLLEKVENLRNEEESEIRAFSNKRKKLAWPFSTYNGILRTQDLIKYIVNKIEANPDLDKHEKKGFKGKSVFLDEQTFHFINDLPAEYMHLGCLGVVRRLLEVTFNVGENKDRVTKRKLSDVSQFNNLIKCVQVVREFSRRCRSLDLGIIKAQEYRNLIYFFFQLFLIV